MDKYYGQYGGQFVSETLMNTLAELEQAFEEAIGDPAFLREYEYYLKEYVGRETPLYFAQRLTEKYGPRIYLKREDLNHTGAHKINNVIGQILLARRMGKTKVIAETGSGAAWRGDCYRCGAVRHGVHGLYGGGGYRTPETECASHGNAGCQSGQCDVREQYTQRCYE